MSVEAIAWVLNHAPVESPVSKLVLVALANHAHPDGTAAFPSVKTICRYTCLSERSVRTHLDALEKLGVIKRCDQRIVAAYIDRPDRRPIGYDIQMTGVQETQVGRKRGAGGSTNGVQEIPQRGAGDAPKPSYKPPKETVQALVDSFVQALKEATPNGTPREHQSAAWGSAFETILGHGADPEQIERVMRCALRDQWWSRIVRNPQKLEKHWERLSLEFRSTSPSGTSSVNGALSAALQMVNGFIRIKKTDDEILEYIRERPEDEQAALMEFYIASRNKVNV